MQLRVPQRGDKRALLETVERNAKEAFTQHKLKRASDLTARSAALQEIQDALGLDTAPLRIECFDVSHVQGTDVVASLVVFEDGLAAQVGVPAVRDPRTAAAGRRRRGDRAKSIRRRFRRRWPSSGRRSTPAGGTTTPRRAEGRPGQRCRRRPGRHRPGDRPAAQVRVPAEPARRRRRAPQVAAAAAALAELGIDDVAVCGLAKRLEEVWLPGEPDPVILPRTSEALYLLQRVRDEAHRFAITYHRQKRSRAMTDVGAGRRARAGRDPQDGAAEALRLGAQAAAADVEEIAAVPGFGAAHGRGGPGALHGRPATTGSGSRRSTGRRLGDAAREDAA